MCECVKQKKQTEQKHWMQRQEQERDLQYGQPYQETTPVQVPRQEDDPPTTWNLKRKAEKQKTKRHLDTTLQKQR